MTQRFKLGDLFEVQLDSSTVRYFQYVAKDATQLDSHVVRVFQRTYDVNAPIDCCSIVAGDIDFYAHVYLGTGVNEGLWRKVGHAKAPSRLDILFRDSDDYGNPEIKVSRNWFVWKINAPSRSIGELRSRYQGAEIGVVVPADSLIYRIRNGSYDFVYPGH